MSFLRGEAGFSLRDTRRSSVIHERLCWGQLRWFGHLIRMPPGQASREMLMKSPACEGQTEARFRDYIPHLDVGP